MGITKVYNGPTYMPCINHIVAPVAHWGPRTLKIKSCTWRWYAVASGVTGDAEHPQMARSTYGSYSGSYGSRGTQNSSNGETYMTLMYSGSQGLIEDPEWKGSSRSISCSCSGSQCSLGTMKVHNDSTYMPLMYDSYSGCYGSLGTPNS